MPYRGRIAPSPTGYLHLGHARTFWVAQQRARRRTGTLLFRNEDLDRARCRPVFVEAMFEDLAWFGLTWEEGPDRGGPYAPYQQSLRLDAYERAFETLREKGFLYPCSCSRQDVLRALGAPHGQDEEVIYPGTCRPVTATASVPGLQSGAFGPSTQGKISWRFKVTPGEEVAFQDGAVGPQKFVAGADFGDFVVWRHDGLPSYQLAVVVDDAFMQITEVVRGADLLLSTARQILLYRALDLPAPTFFHCPLMLDSSGVRLAKRHDALSLRALRQRGLRPEELQKGWEKLPAGL